MQGDSDKFYNLLGVSKTADAAEIKKAYRKAAIKNHPDKGGDPEKVSEFLSDNADAFRRLTRARGFPSPPLRPPFEKRTDQSIDRTYSLPLSLPH